MGLRDAYFSYLPTTLSMWNVALFGSHQGETVAFLLWQRCVRLLTEEYYSTTYFGQTIPGGCQS